MNFLPESNHYLNPEQIRLPKELQPKKSGVLSRFLYEEFLVDFISDNDLRGRTVEVATQLLVPFFDSTLIDKVILTGSVAKCLAHGKPQNFVDYAIATEDIYTAIAEKTDDVGMSFILKALPTDMDIKIKPKNDVSFGHLAYRIVKTFAKQDELGEAITSAGRTSLTFLYENFQIKIDAGVIPTNPRLQNMTIHIKEPGGESDLFHVDIGLLPHDAQSAYTDKRTGLTSDKQDLCTAELTLLDDGQIAYRMYEEAISVMQRQDQIVTESEDPWSVWEISLRALRHNILHQFMQDADPDMPFSELFLPYFTSNSLFGLRRRAHKLIETAEPSQQNVKRVLQKELALCLTIDPFVTTQFLRDSGMSGYIPGFRDLSRDQWNSLLRSKYFSISLPTDTRAATIDQRNTEYIQLQHKLYLQGASEFSGLWRFMRSLQEIGESRIHDDDFISAYLRLWEDGAIKKDYSLDRIQRIVFHMIKPLTDHEGIRFSDEQLLRLSLVYAVLENHKSGVTARELGEIYRQHRDEDAIFYGSYPFDIQFLELKLLGLIGKNSINRIDQQGKIVPVEFYFPISERSDLRAKVASTRDKINFRLNRSLSILYRYGVNSVEALMSLTPYDLELLMRRGEMSNSEFMKAYSDIKSVVVEDVSF